MTPAEIGGRQYTLRHVSSVGDTSLITIGAQGQQRGFRFADFQLGRELGRGEGGAVTVALHTPSNTLFALKEICIAGQAERHQLAMELKTHCECGAMANIVQLFDTFYEEGRVYLVLEYMDWGSLEVLLRVQANMVPPCRMDEGALAVVIRGITAALCFLHEEHQLIHRDLKPGNVVLSTKGAVKLSDFGTSRMLDSMAMGQTFVGTASYMSPERLQGFKYSHKADIWSLGIIAMEMALGRHPFLRAEGETVFFEMMQQVVNEPITFPADSGMSPALVDFVQCCLQKNDAQRWGAKDLLNHGFLVAHADKTDQDVERWLQQSQIMHLWTAHQFGDQEVSIPGVEIQNPISGGPNGAGGSIPMVI